jgi:hypothetical protein
MREEGCAWSLLFTSEEARSLYERHGWRTCPTRYCQGALAEGDSPASAAYAVRPFDPEHESGGWEQLAALCDAYNATRPLTVVRGLTYWQGYLRIRVLDWIADGAHVLVVYPTADPANLYGYVLVHLSDRGFLLNEMAVHPDHPQAIDALFEAIRSHYAVKDIVGGRVILPNEHRVNAAVEHLFKRVEHGASDTLMMRPLAGDVDDKTLERLAHAPGAIFWPMDEV